MKYRLPLLLAASLLAACTQQPAPAPTAATPTPVAPATPEPAAAPKCVVSKGYDLLPKGVCMTQRYRLLGERSYVDKLGRDRRRVTFGFMGKNADTVVKDVSSAFRAGHFNVRPKVTEADGSLTVPITKKELGTIYLVARDVPSTDPANPVAKGNFYVDFAAAPAPVAQN